MMNDYIRSKHVEQTEDCGIKIDYKNCASRWSLTHCNMMRGTHNVKLMEVHIMLFPMIKVFCFYTSTSRSVCVCASRNMAVVRILILRRIALCCVATR